MKLVKYIVAGGLLVLILSRCAPAERSSFRVVGDLAYAEGRSLQTLELDVYAPEGDGRWPMVVILHGGNGSKNDSQIVSLSEHLATQGRVVLTPSYSRITPDLVIAEEGRAYRDTLESTLCAIRFAQHQGSEYGGDIDNLTIVGHSAGGLFGLMAALLGEEMFREWDDFESLRGAPSHQVSCVIEEEAQPVQGFVGYNGAYFILQGSPLPDTDPELWRLTHPTPFVERNSDLKLRFILGSFDETQPDWHKSAVKEMETTFLMAGHDVDLVEVEAGHDLNFDSPAWDMTLEAVLEVVNSR